MSSIRIIAVPDGPYLEQIRREWLDLVIPLPNEVEYAVDPTYEAETEEMQSDQYFVHTKTAIEALRSAGREKAAEFWERMTFDHYLAFKKDVCELLVA
jgi:hypothetical protein